MLILGIDTSCDDTSIAVIKSKGQKSQKNKKGQINLEILSNIISSQEKLHQKYGGVYPSLAKREHQKNLVPVLQKALSKANLLQKRDGREKKKNKSFDKILNREDILRPILENFLEKYQKPKINALAVTVGPGLEPCLWVGVNFAKALSWYWHLPLVSVNHIEAHILANWLSSAKIQSQKTSALFPAICLVVSGGHTQLILMRKIGNYQIIGETRDDAAGECFDKTARILGFPYPGGPAIAAVAEKLSKGGNNHRQLLFKLPRPMMYSKDYDFSFSGLKTAVLYAFQKASKNQKASKLYKELMAKEIQEAIIDVLIKKTLRAVAAYQAKSVMLGGGVTANNELQKRLLYKLKKLDPKINFFSPAKKLCTDNGAMVGATGYFNLLKSKKEFQEWQTIKARANLRIGETKP